MQKKQGLLACVLIASALAGCTQTLESRNAKAAAQAPSASAAAAEHRQAAASLERTASKTASVPERDELLGRAAEEWYAGGDIRRAQRSIEAASALPGPGASPVRQLIAARVELDRGAPQRAVDRILKLPQPLPPGLSADLLEVEGRARFALGDGGGAVNALVAREHWLNDSTALRANERLIWDGLQRPGLSLRPPSGADATTRGWLELASIVVGHDAAAARPQLMAWRERYPKHPANGTVLPTLLAEGRSATQVPHRVALVLPLSGRLAPAAGAVRDGFLTGYFGVPGDAPTRPEILVFDTDQLGPEGAYAAAIRAGADFVVGPLSKPDVSRLAALPQREVPLLALNTLSDPTSGGFYQFALAPEEEAEQTAARALADGHFKALALVSGDDFGRRLLESFTRAFERGGGRVIATEPYDPAANDHQAEIKRLLALDVAEARYRALVSTLGEKLQFEARPRQDADFLFLGAQAAQARLLRPELRFHFADDLPIYATSSIYDPQPKANEDLEGIIFADMPWIIAPPVADDPLRLALNELGADEWQRRGRLYALGYDAYRLVPLLYGNRGERTQVAGATGLLTVDSDGRVHRELSFARLHNGVAQAIPDSVTTMPPGPIEASPRP